MTNSRFTVNRTIYYFRRHIWRQGRVKFRDNPRVFVSQRLYMVFKGLFVENHWGYAAQLTLNTMMAIIPVVAVIFAVGRGFGFEDYIVESLRRILRSQPQVADSVVTFANSYIEYTHTGVIVGVSLVFMLYSVISLFNNIEGVFNGIWGVKKDRDFTRAVFDYVSIIFLVPLAIVLLSGLSVFFYSVLGRLPDFQVLGPWLKAVVGFLLPLVMLTGFFTLLYMFVPNTKVRFSMVWFPALLAGLCIIGLQAVYIHYQVLFASYSIIYGSLAALPLLMLWMQFSWFICIGFAELGRANQELADGHVGEDRADSMLEQLRKSAMVVSLLCQRQRRGAGPSSARELITLTHYSHAQLMRSLHALVTAGLVARTHRDDGNEVYTLNRAPGDLTMGAVTAALLGRKSHPASGEHHIPISPQAEQQLDAMLREYLSAMDAVSAEELVISY